jgi:hypothetical protein
MEIEIYLDDESKTYFVLLWWKEEVVERYLYLDREEAYKLFNSLKNTYTNARIIEGV